MLDGRKLNDLNLSKGNFLGPTIIEVNTLDNKAYSEELFGPVLTILKVDTFEQALEIINKN